MNHSSSHPMPIARESELKSAKKGAEPSLVGAESAILNAVKVPHEVASDGTPNRKCRAIFFPEAQSVMTRAERDILAVFRRFRVGPNKMLCLNCFVDEKFLAAMELLIKHKFVVKDRPKHAYYLTRAGYDASLSA